MRTAPADSGPCGLCIMTVSGWRPVGGPMQPVPPIRQWWSFGGAAGWDALFIDSDGTDLRVTGRWTYLSQARSV